MQAMSSSLQTVLLQQQAAVKLLLGVLVISAATFVVAAAKPNSSCNRRCGSLDIPYPFGTSEGCYLDSSFLITCNSSSSSETSNPTPFLGIGNITVLNISLDGELRVSSPIARYCPNENYVFRVGLFSKAFPISYTKNVFTAIGCNTLGVIGSVASDKNYRTGCMSLCDNIDDMVNGSCSGIGCCQTPIPDGIKDFIISFGSFDNFSTVSEFNPCGFAFVVEKKEYNFSTLDFQNMQNKDAFPLVLNWTIGNQTCEDAKKDLTGYACKADNSECYNSTNGLGIAATAPQAITETHISLVVAKILMSVKLQIMGALLMHASTMWGLTAVLAPRDTKEMGGEMEMVAVLNEAIIGISLLPWVSE